MASPTRWTWVWVNSGSWWWTGRTGMLQFMGSQRVGHNWAAELNWTELNWTEILSMGFSGGSYNKESACNSGDLGLIPELGRSLGEGNGYPFWYTCLGNPMDRGGWRGLQSMGSQIVGHDWATNTFTFEVLPTLMMFRWDCILCKMRTFTLDSVLCARGHGDLGGDLAWPLSWKTPCLCLNVSA